METHARFVGKTDPIERGLRRALFGDMALLLGWKNRPDRKGIKTIGSYAMFISSGVGKTDPIERGLRPW